MVTILLLVFFIWLPLAITLQAILRATDAPFARAWKAALYGALAAPAIAASWLTALAARNQRTVDKLSRIGAWFTS